MSFIFSFFIFFLCLSLHACNARHIGFIDKGPSTVQFSFSGEGEIPDLHSIGGAINGDGIFDKRQSHGGATTRNHKQKESKDLSGHVPTKPLVSVSWRVPVKNHGTSTTGNGTYAGSETFESSSRMGFLNRATTTEGSRRRALLVVGSGDTQVKDGVNMSVNNKAQEEQVAVTDYDPPHQTPPIHNRRHN